MHYNSGIYNFDNFIYQIAGETDIENGAVAFAMHKAKDIAVKIAGVHTFISLLIHCLISSRETTFYY